MGGDIRRMSHKQCQEWLGGEASFEKRACQIAPSHPPSHSASHYNLKTNLGSPEKLSCTGLIP